MKKKNVFAIIASTLLIIGMLVGFKYWNDYRTERSTASAEAIRSLTISFEEEEGEPKRVFEYGYDVIKTRDLVTEHGGELFVDIDEIDCSKVGVTEVTYLMTTKDKFGRDFSNSETVKYEVIDTVLPVIELEKEKIELEWGASFDPSSNVLSVRDPIDGKLEEADELSKGKYFVESEIEKEKSGTYTVKVSAMDRNGNESSAEFDVVIAEKPPEPEPEPEPDDDSEGTDSDRMDSEFNGKPYQIRINRAYNTITIYTAGEDARYSVPFKAMICVAPSNIELGRYYTGAKWPWVGTYGDIYAQYATQFAPGTLIQSVPYNSQNPADLRWEDYNKLGSNSETYGSVWLTVEDAKWIYDNVGSGTEILFYDDYQNPGPMGQPGTYHLEPDSDYRGWDPTDPDPNNPWR